MAGYANPEHKSAHVSKAATKLDILKFFIRLAWETKCLDHKGYAALAAPLAEVGKMVGGWRKQMNDDKADTIMCRPLAVKRVADEEERVDGVPIVVEPIIVEIAPVVVPVQHRHVAVAVVQTEGERPCRNPPIHCPSIYLRAEFHAGPLAR